MTIAFICPNGHELSAPRQLAGKAGKCPKCNTKFLIPTLEEIGVSDSAAEDPPAAAKNSGDLPSIRTSGEKAAEKSAAGRWKTDSSMSGKSPGSDKHVVSEKASLSSPDGAGKPEKTKASEKFFFLCPNGHTLNGPPTLKGKLGQCPHCKEKFRIPADDDVETDEAPIDAQLNDDEPLEEVPVGEIVEELPPEEEATETPNTGDADVEEAEMFSVEEEMTLPESLPAWHMPPPAVGYSHRLAELFGWMWTQRDANSTVELILKDGQRITPAMYSAELSQQVYGVFTLPTEDDRYTMLTIPWDSVAQVVIRELADVPHDLFE